MVFILVIIGVVMHGIAIRSIVAAGESVASNRFSTKNSYNASLELWPDQPALVDEDEHIIHCNSCRPIQVSKLSWLPAENCLVGTSVDYLIGRLSMSGERYVSSPGGEWSA